MKDSRLRVKRRYEFKIGSKGSSLKEWRNNSSVDQDEKMGTEEGTASVGGREQRVLLCICGA